MVRWEDLTEQENEVLDELMAEKRDDNERILSLIKERMDIGVERYGHGLRQGDDTRQWGTKKDSWNEMALEEVLDGMIYLAAQLIRILDKD